MKNDHAWIDYELDGKTHRWQGDPLFYEDDPKLYAALNDILETTTPETQGSKILSIAVIERAGGRILEIHSIREDGTIRIEDFPDAYVN